MRNNYFISRLIFVLLIVGNTSLAMAQKKAKPVRTMGGQPYLFFPHPMEDRKWRIGLGMVFTTTPLEITEEIRLSVPALDFHVLRNLRGSFYLDGRLNFQLVQNHLTAGIRWAHPVTERLSFSIGDDMGFWYGSLSLEGFNNSGVGVLNYPNASVGYKLADDLLLTFKTEALLNLLYYSQVGTAKISSAPNTLAGVGFSFLLEQPFYKQQHFTVGFRMLYSNFNWQFWALYPTFDRKLFFPQLIFGFII